MAVYTTTDLIGSVKSRIMLPDASTGSLSSDSILLFASEELRSRIVPAIMSVREKYYETQNDYPLVAGNPNLAIPSRAVGMTVSSIQYVYNNAVYPLQPIDPCTISTTNSSATPRAFYFQNNNIVLFQTPNQSLGSIRLFWTQRPNALVQTSQCGQIASFDAVANTVTLSSIPSTWTTGTVFDFIPAARPNTPYGQNSVSLGVGGTTVSFASLPSTVAIGDWLSVSETTCIPEIPYEFWTPLAQATACKLLESIGDVGNLPFAMKARDEAIATAIKLIEPRDLYGQKKIVSGWRAW